MQLPQNHYFVYIFGAQPRTDVQIGVVGDLNQQAALVMSPSNASQTDNDKYKLVYYEHYDKEEVALNREKQIKGGNIDATYNLIESMNPNWLDLSDLLPGVK